jgi:hypothetical protein
MPMCMQDTSFSKDPLPPESVVAVAKKSCTLRVDFTLRSISFERLTLEYAMDLIGNSVTGARFGKEIET